MWDSASEEFEDALTYPSGGDTVGAVAAWVNTMRSLRIPPSADVAANHVTVAAATARDAVATDMSPLPAPSRWTLVRRRLARSTLVTGIVAKVLGASVAMATVTGGVAATGVLPDPIQDPIAAVYNAVGFDFPTSADDEADEADDGVGTDDAVTDDSSDTSNGTPAEVGPDVEGVENSGAGDQGRDNADERAPGDAGDQGRDNADERAPDNPGDHGRSNAEDRTPDDPGDQAPDNPGDQGRSNAEDRTPDDPGDQAPDDPGDQGRGNADDPGDDEPGDED